MKTNRQLLLIGMVLLTLPGCSTKTDYDALSTWEFINNSSHTLKIEGNENEPSLAFDLAKGEEHSFDITFGTGREVSNNDFYSPYDPEFVRITLDGERIITTSKITDKKNYTSKKVSNRHYQFTYTFTDADFPVE